MARRILDRQRKDMRQIVMVTQPDGRIYKNAFGLDPFIVADTCAEVAACRKSGIMIAIRSEGELRWGERDTKYASPTLGNEIATRASIARSEAASPGFLKKTHVGH